MRPATVLSLGNFFSSAHYFLIVFILAPYLATKMPATIAGLAVALGAVITFVAFLLIHRFSNTYGAQRLGIILGAMEMLVLLVLATGPSAVLAFLLAACACAIPPLIAYQLDLLLEAAVLEKGMIGRVRSAFLTAGNMSLVLSLIVVGFLLGTSDRYGVVFLVAALSLIPFILLMIRDGLPERPRAPAHGVRDAYARLRKNRGLRAAALGNGILKVFYSLTNLYIPLYLHSVLGFPWDQLGPLFAIMLIPLVLFEYPAGWLADTKLGDKRLMAAGFVIAGLAFAACGFISRSTSFASLAGLLMLANCGAALIESMTEGHFFRLVSVEDAEMVSLFRMMRPFGSFIGPIMASVLLALTGYVSFFAISGTAILLCGLAVALPMPDTPPAGGTRNPNARPIHLSRALRGRV